MLAAQPSDHIWISVCRAGEDSSELVQVDGKSYLNPTGTTPAALKKCQLSLLPVEEHKKKYVKEGKITVCKTIVSLSNLYNGIVAAGGIKEVKEVRPS